MTRRNHPVDADAGGCGRAAALGAGVCGAVPYAGRCCGRAYNYARSHNPTWTELEHAIAQMESGELAAGNADGAQANGGESYKASALVFASGMAACAAVFGAVLRPGDVAVLPTNSYYTARS
jgi:cystathionine gamma-lyase